MAHLTRKDVQPLIVRALREDAIPAPRRGRQAAFSDVTSRAVIPADARVRARLVAKASGVLAGGPVVVWTFQTVDPALRCVLRRRDSARLTRGDTILTVEGRAHSILAAERTALNFVGHLSGIATLTRAFVQRVRPSRAAILDTRKTLPGLRALEKYAVRAGNGDSHRKNLAEAILIKANHLTAMNRDAHLTTRDAVIRTAVRRARRAARGKFVEVEVANVREFRAALEARPNAILLDNWRLADIRRAVALRRGIRPGGHRPLLEVSGGVTLANVRAIARTGIERISIGRLTHSAPALDVSLQVIS